MDKKSPDAFRTISEVAEWLGVPTHVLRFWESRFAQVKPVKRAGGRRYYRPADMELLGGIRKLLHDDGMTIRGVQKLLREEGVKHVAAMAPALDGPAMVDVTPSNVVELRSPPPQATPVAPTETAVPDAQDEPAAPSDPASPEPETTPVPEAEVAIQPPAEAPSPPAAARDPLLESQTSPEAHPGAQATLEDAPLPDVEPEVATAGEEFVQPSPEAPTGSAPLTQTGFDFGEATPQDTSLADDVVESPESVEFHAHGTSFTRPPAREEVAPADMSDATPPADLPPAGEYEDPSELPRLGAGDLPLATRDPGGDMPPPPPGLTADPTVPDNAPEAAPSEEAMDVAAPANTLADQPEAASVPPVEETGEATPETVQELAIDAPPAQEAPIVDVPPIDPAPDEPASDLPPLPLQPETEAPALAAGSPATQTPEEMPAVDAPSEDADSPEPAEEAEAGPEAPEVLDAADVTSAPPVPPAAPAPVDISHIPSDPEEDDISPAGPSLPSRMRRLAARSPQGSPAQIRALGDRLQELSGRMKRDAPRRGMQ